MRIVSFCLVLFCGGAFSLFAGPKAQWIVYPEDQEKAVRQERYFRTEFDVPAKPVKEAAVCYVIDDIGSVYLNGKNVSRTSPRRTEYPSVKQFDVTKAVVGGRNVLCASCTNAGGPGGFILRLAITYQDGSIQEVFTDTNWKTSRKKSAGWKKTGFDSRTWKPSRSIADYNGEIWSRRYDMLPLYAHDDAVAELARRQEVKRKFRQTMERLANAPDERAKITYKNGGAFFDVGEKLYRPVLYNCNFGWRDVPTFREKITNFMQADLPLIAFGINSQDFWKGPGKYDYKALEKILERAFALAPDARFLFAISFTDGPKWWNQLHPEETVKYAREDKNYSKTNNIGTYTAPSYASELWLKEASEVVRRIVEYIESKPYRKHVFAYRLDAGVYVEWHYYGMAGSMPDVSDPMVKLFRSYLREKYRDDVSALRKAWNQPEVTFENALPPPPEVRLQYLDGALRDPVKHAWSIDFIQCIQRSLRNALLTLNKTAKEASNGRALVGNYCGYFFGMGFTAEGWHIVNDEFLRSPYVDYQVSPCCYAAFYRNIGSSQLARSLAASYRLHNKICIFEADGRTCLVPRNTQRGRNCVFVDTIQESIAMLSRDLAQTVSKGCGYWYYDFGWDWYNEPEILQFFHRIAPVYDAVKDFHSSAEIAYVGDWDSLYYHAIQARRGGPQTYTAINYLPHEMKVAGFQFDAYSFADLDDPALQKYKLYVFPQLCYVTPEKLAKLAKLKKAGKTLLFLSTPGWLTPHGPDANSLFQTTGIRAEVLHKKAVTTTTLADGSVMDGFGLPGEQKRKYSPVLKITDPKSVILGTVTLEDGTKVPSYAKKKNADGSTSYVCSAPAITAAEFRRIAKAAGVHCYSDSNKGVVFANNSMISLHTGMPGEYTLHAKRPVKWTMVYPEKRAYPTRKADLTFRVTRPDTCIFTIEP